MYSAYHGPVLVISVSDTQTVYIDFFFSFLTDVNECEVFRLDQGGKLCVHECVNVPGSYHCSCPTGYKLLPDGRSCEGE